MKTEYNVYCDESCHLENDGQKAMVLGAVWCPKDKRLEIAERMREIKQKHGLERDFEIKWTKWLETEGYLAVLAERKGYTLPWTAFYIERQHQRDKYTKRWRRNTSGE